jgi:outer membrane protein assembly factor BamE (lipoprotein component of BamABCDE complex)
VKKTICILAAALAACAPQANLEPVTTRNSELTHGNVQLHLETGKTTQAEVLEVFGAPNITTIDSQGREVWSYQRAASAQQSASSQINFGGVLVGGIGGGALGGGNSASGFESTSRMMTLIIKFDDEKIVADFRSRVSNF